MFFKEILEFFNKSLTLNCPQIILTQNKLNKPKIYQGSGLITRTSKENLEVELSYLDEDIRSTMLEEYIGIGELEIIGTTVKKEEYFSLTATDSEGREWISTDVFVYNHESHLQVSKIKLYAKCYEIWHTMELPKLNDSFIRLQISDKIKIPFNKKIPIPQEFPLGLEATVFEACSYQFAIYHQQDSTIIEIRSTNGNEFPDFIGTRACEALQFVVGDFISWSTLEFIQENQRTIRIRPYHNNENRSQKFRQPLRFEKIDLEKDIWLLYEKYLNHILNYQVQELHPISGWVRRIIESRELFLETEILTVSVAIESLLGLEPLKDFTLDTHSDNLESQILLVKDKIKGLEIDESFKNRLEGFLNSTKSVSATDRLRNLISKGLVNEKVVKAWKKIRNLSAHGYNLENHQLEEYLNLLNQATILFHQLIFLMIGYTGKYTDYTQIGWRDKEFNQKLKPD
jgi:hypothetical protein